MWKNLIYDNHPEVTFFGFSNSQSMAYCVDGQRNVLGLWNALVMYVYISLFFQTITPSLCFFVISINIRMCIMYLFTLHIHYVYIYMYIYYNNWLLRNVDALTIKKLIFNCYFFLFSVNSSTCSLKQCYLHGVLFFYHKLFFYFLFKMFCLGIICQHLFINLSYF